MHLPGCRSGQKIPLFFGILVGLLLLEGISRAGADRHGAQGDSIAHILGQV